MRMYKFDLDVKKLEIKKEILRIAKILAKKRKTVSEVHVLLK